MVARDPATNEFRALWQWRGALSLLLRCSPRLLRVIEVHMRIAKDGSAARNSVFEDIMQELTLLDLERDG